MKRLPRKLLVTLMVIVGLILVVVVGLRIFFPAEKVKDMAVKMAGQKLGRDISVEAVGLSFTDGLGVELEGVAVANPPGFAGEPLLFAKNIDLKLKLFPLFRGEIRVHRLVVERPRLRLVRQSDGIDNFTFEFQEKAPGPDGTSGAGGQEDPDEVAISFDSLEIQDGSLVFRDETVDQGISLLGLDLAAGLTNPRPGEFLSAGRLEVDSLLVAGEQPVPTVAAEMDYDLSFDSRRQLLELIKGDLKVNGLPLGLQGSLNTLPDSVRAKGKLRAEGIALTDLFAFLTPEQLAPLEPFTIAGDVSLEADLDFDQIRAEPVFYEGRAMISRLQATSADIEGEMRVREIALDFRPDHLHLKSEGGSFEDQPVDLTLTVVDFENPRLDGAVSGSVDLAFVKPFLPPEKKMDLAGLCTLEATFSGPPDDVAQMNYAGRATFKDVSYRDPVLPDDLEQLNGTVSFDPDSVTAERITARFGAGDLTLTGKLVDHLPYFLPAEKDNRDNLTKPRFTFDARSKRIDIDKLFPAATPGAAAGDGPVATLPGTLSTVSIPDLLCQGTIKADTLIYSQVPFTDVTGRIRMKNRVLECYNVTTNVYGGRAGGQVAIDLVDLNDPRYEGTFKAEDIEADNFITRFAGFGGVVYGKAGLSGSFSARGRDPKVVRETLTMDSTAALISGKVVTGQFVDSALGSLAAQAGEKFDKEQALKDLTTLIKVENGRVGLDQFKTRLGNFGDLSLGGSYGFSGDLEYKGAILLTKDQTARLYASGGLAGSVASLFGNQAERLNLPLSVGGTVKNPKMSLDYSELTNNLKSQLTDDLKDDLNSKLKGLLGK